MYTYICINVYVCVYTYFLMGLDQRIKY